MPKVSVIIPTYKGTKYLSESLESIFQQTYQDFETIVVEDALNGLAGPIVETLGKQYGRKIRYFQQEHNGVSAARNRGLTVAFGEYVAFQDDDDIWLPTFLEKTVPLLTGYDAVKPSCYKVFVDGEKRIAEKIFWDSSKINVEPNLFKGLLKENSLGSPTAIYKIACFKTIGSFDQRLSAHEDWDLWLRLARAGFNLYGLSEPLYIYRKFLQREGQIKKLSEHIEGSVIVVDRYGAKEAKKNKELRVIYAVLFWNYARIALYTCKNIKLFLICFLKSIQFDFNLTRFRRSLRTVLRKI